MAEIDSDVLHRLRELVTAAGRVMSAAEDDRETAAQLVTRLKGLEGRVDQGLRQIPKVISESIGGLTSTTATQTASLLSEKFDAADAAAIKAATRYELASNMLQRRFWMTIVAVNSGVILLIALSAYLLMPSRDEINEKREELAELKERVADLERRGGRAELQPCGEHLCIRTIEAEREAPLRDQDGKGAKTYRVIWGS